MKLGDYKLIFIVTAIIGSLLIASPAIAGAIRLPEGEQFSELYLLGPNRMAENYPYNIAIGQNYSVYINVGNQLGSSAYYVIYVKFGMPNRPITKRNPRNTKPTSTPIRIPLLDFKQQKLAGPSDILRN